jgi:tetratricopeptide (TPR) repeat protein
MGQERDMKTCEETYQDILGQVGDKPYAHTISDLENLLKTYPDFAPAYNDLGVLNYSYGDRTRSLQYYVDATRLDPGNHLFQKNLADYYYVEMGNVEDALHIYAKILSEEPEDVDCLTAAGHICEALNKPDDAIPFYSRVLDIEPWNLDIVEKMDKLKD